MAIQRALMTDSRKEDVFYEEAIKTLRTNMQFSGVETKSIVITSCYPNEGKSDVTFQLAVEIGKMGKKVLIIDADIRKSNYVKRFQVEQKVDGLSQYLSGQVNKEKILYSTNYSNVDFIFAGPYAPNPSELLEQELFSKLIEETRKGYDYVLIDTPPMLSMSDASIVAKQCDGAILVIQNEAVSRKDALRAKDQLKKSQDHISLAYAYGDGSYKSGELAKEAVSTLFYGLNIQGYCAINLDALSILSDSVGGVTVTVPNDSLEEKYPEFKNGSQVTLDGTNTEIFVRYRDINVHQSAIARMERQQVFIKAFEEAAKKKIAEDSGYTVKMYSDLEPYMVTNISKDQLLKITQSMTEGKEDTDWTVPGEAVEGEGHDEYHVDDNALYEKMIETFYKKVSDPN